MALVRACARRVRSGVLERRKFLGTGGALPARKFWARGPRESACESAQDASGGQHHRRRVTRTAPPRPFSAWGPREPPDAVRRADWRTRTAPRDLAATPRRQPPGRPGGRTRSPPGPRRTPRAASGRRRSVQRRGPTPFTIPSWTPPSRSKPTPSQRRAADVTARRLRTRKHC